VDGARLPERLLAARLAFHRRLAEALPLVRVQEVAGVEAVVSPGAPERSVLNAAVLAAPPPTPPGRRARRRLPGRRRPRLDGVGAAGVGCRGLHRSARPATAGLSRARPADGDDAAVRRGSW